MSKRFAFIVLALLAGGFAWLAVQREPAFRAELWSELFWLTAGTLTTTFVLDAILERGARAGQRRRDAFAFRALAVDMLNALCAIATVRPAGDLFEAALSGDAAFTAAVQEVAPLIEQSSGFDSGAYAKSYLNIASALRTMSWSYIRLFAANRRDMLTFYRTLNEFASQWVYVDEFDDESRKYTASLSVDDSRRTSRNAAFQTKVTSAKQLAVSTATQLATLSARTAAGKSFYD